MDIRTQKNELRAFYSQKRQELSSSEKRCMDIEIANIFLNLSAYKSSKQILFYASKDSEVSTDRIFSSSLEDGKKCFFPKCYEHSKMVFYNVKDPSDLVTDAYNIKAPNNEDEPYLPLPSDIILVPAMAYDRKGYRLGYGNGFYDRFLTDFWGTKIGIC